MPISQNKSKQFFEKSTEFIPGGVNSPVRAFKSVGGTPPVIRRAEGPYLFDVDGNRYIDFVGSWGPAILGHAYPAVVAAVQKTAADGLSFGACSEQELELAELVVNAVPSIEKVRFVNSGTEATMSAIRLARGFTGRDKIIKFAGCYHGHGDCLLSQAGSGVATLGLPDSPGVPKGVVADTLTVPFNDLDAVNSLFDKFPKDIAAVIIEPVAGNMGVIGPRPGYLAGLRELTKKYGALLIFDEVMTGFRVAFGGAQERFGITPDLTCLGKIVGGGMPVGAYGGRAEIMRQLAPEGPVYQAGTLSGNPLAMAAGIATLKELQKPGIYEALDQKSANFMKAFSEIATQYNVPLQTAQFGSMCGFFFSEKPVTNYDQAAATDGEYFSRFFHAMLERSVYLAPSRFEALFISMAHEDAVLREVLQHIRIAVTQ